MATNVGWGNTNVSNVFKALGKKALADNVITKQEIKQAKANLKNSGLKIDERQAVQNYLDHLTLQGKRPDGKAVDNYNVIGRHDGKKGISKQDIQYSFSAKA